MSAPELKPCPFCGCKDVDGERWPDKRVHCYRCGADGPAIRYAPDEKAPTWNSRADLPPTDAEVMAHPKVKALVDAVRHEREMVCQDFGMQLAASQAVDAALAPFTGDKTDG